MSESVTVWITKEELLPRMWSGVDYRIYYRVVPSRLVGKPEEAANAYNASIKMSISASLASEWQLEDGPLVDVLYEHARRALEAMAREGTLGRHAEILLTTTNSPAKRPFDPSRIRRVVPSVFEITLAGESPVAAAGSSSIAAEIVELRDNINALFGERFGGRLLTLPQERHIVDLFTGCNDQRGFSYFASSLGGLAIAFEVKDLRRALVPSGDVEEAGASPVDVEGMKSLALVEKFLQVRTAGNAAKPILDVLKNLNRLRQMYPVHTDRAEGVLAAHAFFELDYPVRDHGAAGNRLLLTYRDALTQLLAALKMKPD